MDEVHYAEHYVLLAAHILIKGINRDNLESVANYRKGVSFVTLRNWAIKRGSKPDLTELIDFLHDNIKIDTNEDVYDYAEKLRKFRSNIVI